MGAIAGAAAASADVYLPLQSLPQRPSQQPISDRTCANTQAAAAFVAATAAAAAQLAAPELIRDRSEASESPASDRRAPEQFPLAAGSAVAADISSGPAPAEPAVASNEPQAARQPLEWPSSSRSSPRRPLIDLPPRALSVEHDISIGRRGPPLAALALDTRLGALLRQRVEHLSPSASDRVDAYVPLICPPALRSAEQLTVRPPPVNGPRVASAADNCRQQSPSSTSARQQPQPPSAECALEKAGPAASPDARNALLFLIPTVVVDEQQQQLAAFGAPPVAPLEPIPSASEPPPTAQSSEQLRVYAAGPPSSDRSSRESSQESCERLLGRERSPSSPRRQLDSAGRSERSGSVFPRAARATNKRSSTVEQPTYERDAARKVTVSDLLSTHERLKLEAIAPELASSRLRSRDSLSQPRAGVPKRISAKPSLRRVAFARSSNTDKKADERRSSKSEMESANKADRASDAAPNKSGGDGCGGSGGAPIANNNSCSSVYNRSRVAEHHNPVAEESVSGTDSRELDNVPSCATEPNEVSLVLHNSDSEPRVRTAAAGLSLRALFRRARRSSPLTAAEPLSPDDESGVSASASADRRRLEERKRARQVDHHRRLQARIYNFLERPKSGLPIAYHVIVYASPLPPFSCPSPSVRRPARCTVHHNALISDFSV